MKSSNKIILWIEILIVVGFCILLLGLKYNTLKNSIQKKIAEGIELTEDKKKPKMYTLGLDLAGGVDLLYEAFPAPGSKAITQDQMDGLIEIIRRRIDPEGVKEPIVQQIGSDRLNIQVPGESNPQDIKEKLGQMALLQFVDTGDKSIPEGDKIIFLEEGQKPPEETTDADTSETQAQADEGTDQEAAASGEDQTGNETEKPKRKAENHYFPRSKILLEGSDLKTAYLDIGQRVGEPIVSIVFNKQGGRIFAEYTARNIGRYLTITLDGTVISSPRINSAIPHGSGYIEGNFTRESAYNLSVLLRSGALPVKLVERQSRIIGPSLGQESINLSITAAFYGLIVLLIFMIAYYRFVGLMADLALIFYACIFLCLISIFDITMTLPGIAGFILSLGMAVDANVIVFERIKEEINSGKTYLAAIESGFERAFPAIFDSNTTTLITGLVLYWVGSGSIKGFAVTLMLGILISMFSALVVTRALIGIWSGFEIFQRTSLYGWNLKRQD